MYVGVQLNACERVPALFSLRAGEKAMPQDESFESNLSERDLRALAMELALQLPRNQEDAGRVIDLMRAGYDFFLCEFEKPKAAAGDVLRPKFSRRRGGG